MRVFSRIPGLLLTGIRYNMFTRTHLPTFLPIPFPPGDDAHPVTDIPAVGNTVGNNKTGNCHPGSLPPYISPYMPAFDCYPPRRQGGFPGCLGKTVSISADPRFCEN